MVKPKRKPSPFKFRPVKLNSNPMFFGARPQKKSLFSGFGVNPDMNWKQAKKAYPKLKPFADADRDGVRNKFDCKPFDKKRQGPSHVLKAMKGVVANPNRLTMARYQEAEETEKKRMAPILRAERLKKEKEGHVDAVLREKQEKDLWSIKQKQNIRRRFDEGDVPTFNVTEAMVKMGEDDMDESVKRYNESDSPGTMRRLPRKPGSNIIEADFVEATGSDLSDADIEDIMDSDEDPAKYF